MHLHFRPSVTSAAEKAAEQACGTTSTACPAGSRRSVAECGQHLLAKGLNERALVWACIVQVDLFEAELGKAMEPIHMPLRLGRDQDVVVDVLWPERLRCCNELFGRAQHLGDGRWNSVGAPLLVSEAKGLIIRAGPAHMYLQSQRLAFAATLLEGINDGFQLVCRLVDGNQPGGPAAGPLSSRGSECGTEELRRLLGPGVESRLLNPSVQYA